MGRDGGLRSACWALRIGLGLGPFLAGLDKFFNFLADWTMYLSPLVERVLHVSPKLFMRGWGSSRWRRVSWSWPAARGSGVTS
jgi:hypothetical protein